MWMSIEKNNNINIILIDSLESLHQREYGLQTSQQRVLLASHCHKKLTNIKVRWNEGKWRSNEVKRIDQSSRNKFPSTGFFASFCFLLLCFYGFFVVKERNVSFLFICVINWLVNQNFLMRLKWPSFWAHV